MEKCIRNSWGENRGILVEDMNVHVVLFANNTVLLSDNLNYLQQVQIIQIIITLVPAPRPLTVIT